ncbi:hypothetical protein [Streptomyces sp. NBC_01264]|uniref:hypothetical protein n=1 Tax=Streptomyces sp. NBC_01264 TaxID=2903804 RepID=UPI003D2FFFFE
MVAEVLEDEVVEIEAGDHLPVLQEESGAGPRRVPVTELAPADLQDLLPDEPAGTFLMPTA